MAIEVRLFQHILFLPVENVDVMLDILLTKQISSEDNKSSEEYQHVDRETYD